LYPNPCEGADELSNLKSTANEFCPAAPAGLCYSVGASLCDGRDGKSYKLVVIGTQTWMAENLNYNASGSICYNNSDTNCEKYGRLYNWATAMNGYTSSTADPSGVQGICPEGWHLPSQAEWNALTTYIQSTKSCTNCDEQYLRTTTWNSGYDTYGFKALPGGIFSGSYFQSGGSSDASSGCGLWWSATEYNSTNAQNRTMCGGSAAYWEQYEKTYAFSVRCIKN